MTYAETLHYLYSRLPMFSRIGEAAIKKDLHNTIALCAAIGDPQKRFKSIHVAGTNGKGSTSHMLAAVLQSAGYKTGLYTSPHLRDFRERIRINGEMIPEGKVVELVQSLQGPIEKTDPSFFEVTVAMAFHYFAEEQVDIAVIETGLGGRLDSTNIIHPEISVITNIGMDHMNLLGHTLPAIAFEKAGIIKAGIPVVIGETLPETLPVFQQKAREENVSMVLATDQYFLNDWQVQGRKLWVSLLNKHTGDAESYHTDLTGYYQTRNLMTVLTTLHQLIQRGWTIPAKAIAEGLLDVKKKTGLQGRWEILQHDPLLIVDVAHNPDGLRQVLAQLELTPYESLHWIIGVVKDKDISSMLDLLPHQARYYFTQAHIPRALPAEELALAAAERGLKGESFANVNEAVKTAINRAHARDLILVCGSVFVAGELDFPG